MYEKENKQIQFILEQYINCKLGIELPAILKVEQHERWLGKQLQGVNPARESNFDASKMLEKMGSGPLRLHAEKILNIICPYQKERNGRLIGSGSLADPTNLLLEELKDWLFNRLSTSSCRDLKEEIVRRIAYLKNLEESDLFPAGMGEKHLASLLVEIKGILRDEVCIAIEKDLAEESAREELRELVLQSKQLVLHTIQYLYYVIRGGDVSESCNLNDLRGITTDQKMQKSLQTSTGKLLKELVNTESVMGVFSNESEKNKTSQINHQRSSKSIGQGDKSIVASLKSADEVARFNQKIHQALTNSKVETGIHSSFLVDDELLLAFIEMHGLVEALANFILVCQKFHKMAGNGGDIIIYGFANQSMKYFMQSYFPLVKLLFSKIALVNKKIDATYKIENTSKSTWVSSYRKAGDFCARIKAEKDACDAYAGKMLHKVEIGIDEKRRLEIQAQIEDSITSAQSFSERMYGFFPKELSPPPSISQVSSMLTDGRSSSSTSRPRASIEAPKLGSRTPQPIPDTGAVVEKEKLTQQPAHQYIDVNRAKPSVPQINVDPVEKKPNSSANTRIGNHFVEKLPIQSKKSQQDDNSNLDDFKQENTVLKKRVTELQTTTTQLTQEVQQLKTEKDELQNKCIYLDKTNKAFLLLNEKLADENKNFKVKVTQLEEGKVTTDEELRQQREEMQIMRAQIEQLFQVRQQPNSSTHTSAFFSEGSPSQRRQQTKAHPTAQRASAATTRRFQRNDARGQQSNSSAPPSYRSPQQQNPPPVTTQPGTRPARANVVRPPATEPDICSLF